MLGEPGPQLLQPKSASQCRYVRMCVQLQDCVCKLHLSVDSQRHRSAGKVQTLQKLGVCKTTVDFDDVGGGVSAPQLWWVTVRGQQFVQTCPQGRFSSLPVVSGAHSSMVSFSVSKSSFQEKAFTRSCKASMYYARLPCGVKREKVHS